MSHIFSKMPISEFFISRIGRLILLYFTATPPEPSSLIIIIISCLLDITNAPDNVISLGLFELIYRIKDWIINYLTTWQ